MVNARNNFDTNNLPQEIIDKIFSFLNLENPQALATVSKFFLFATKKITCELKKTADYLIKTNGYELVLMSALPGKDENKAEFGKIYLSETGEYIVRDPSGSVKKNRIDKIKINLEQDLNEPDFKSAILEQTTKAGHTLKINMQNFLIKAHKKNQKWLLDYCYQEVVKRYFLDESGQLDLRKIDGILDWAIKCFQPSKITKHLCKSMPIFDHYFRDRKRILALDVGNISMIKFLSQGYDEKLEALELLTVKKNNMVIFNEVFSFFANELSANDLINLLKLALLNNNTRKAKIIVKAQTISEMIKTRGEALFSDMPKRILIGAKLLNYWNEKVVKIDAMNFKYDSRKVSFFKSFYIRSHKQSKLENTKLQLIKKLMKKIIEEDDSIILTEKDFHLINKSKKLTAIYNAVNKLKLAEKLMKKIIEEDDSIILTEKDFDLMNKSKKLTDIYYASLELFEDDSVDILRAVTI
jgi:hypothetical protein